jgi:hypothetical protein
MCVQRQVPGKQVQIVLQQEFQPSLFDADHAAVFVFPEKTVMYQYCIRSLFHRRFQQRHVGGDAADQAHDLRLAFYLQPVRAVVPETGDFKQLLCIIFQFLSVHRFFP